MDEAVVALRRLGREGVLRERVDERRRGLDGVHHPPLRVARMRVEADEGDRYRVRREALAFEVAAAAAVHGVRVTRAEGRHVEVERAATDLLIRRKRDANPAVRDLWMRDQAF